LACFFNRDYAEVFTTAVKKWFVGPLSQEKIPKLSVLGAESFT
jgi:hypothetical protein